MVLLVPLLFTLVLCLLEDQTGIYLNLEALIWNQYCVCQCITRALDIQQNQQLQETIEKNALHACASSLLLLSLFTFIVRWWPLMAAVIKE